MIPFAMLAALTIAHGMAQYGSAKQSSAYARNLLGQQSNLQAQASRDQLDQINNQSTVDMSARAISAAREKAQLITAAGEAGVGGNSPNISEMRSGFSEGYDMTTLRQNRLAMIKQSTLEGTAAQMRIQNELYRNAPPSPLASILTIGANVAGLSTLYPSAPKDPTAE